MIAVSRSMAVAVGLLDGAQAGGDAGFAGGDGLAVAAAVGVFGQGLAVAFDFADVGFAFVGVGGDGEQGDVGGGGVQDEADGLGLGVSADQGEDAGAVGVGPGWFGVDAALPDPVVETRRAWTSARSIWSQTAAKFSPIGPSSVPRSLQ